MRRELKEAHERMLATLPVRKHSRPAPEHRQSAHSGKTVSERERMAAAVKKLRAQGVSATNISRQLGCSVQTVHNYVNKTRLKK